MTNDAEQQGGAPAVPDPPPPGPSAIDTWLEAAAEAAIRQGCQDLLPLLAGLAPSMHALRAAPFNDRADRS